MKFKFHYQTITGYEVLPPKWKILNEEDEYKNPTDRYLEQVDKLLDNAQSRTPYGPSDDIVSMVFANQAMTHELSSRHLASLIQERRTLTEKQLRDVNWEIDELQSRKPLRPRGPGFQDDGRLTEVERQIFNLEWQKRALEHTLWRDTHELRTSLMDERREQAATDRRIGYLRGGEYGRV